MTSLFSSFDLFYFYKYYILMFLFILWFFNSSFVVNFHNVMQYSLLMKIMGKFFFSLKNKNFSKFSLLMIIATFLLLITTNTLSVFSYSYPISSQFGLVFGFSVAMWLSLIIFNIMNNSKSFLSHFIPEGSPIYLVIFLFLIELISSFIRPLTLSVRLVANILAGHLLLILLSKLVFLMPVGFFSYMILNLVEIFVGIIQSYILCTMITLYYSEIH